MNTKKTRIRKVVATVVAILVLGTGGYSLAKMRTEDGGKAKVEKKKPVDKEGKGCRIKKGAEYRKSGKRTSDSQAQYYFYYYEPASGANPARLTGPVDPSNSMITEGEAIDESGCDGTTVVCAYGYNVQYTSFPVNNPPSSPVTIYEQDNE